MGGRGGDSKAREGGCIGERGLGLKREIPECKVLKGK